MRFGDLQLDSEPSPRDSIVVSPAARRRRSSAARSLGSPGSARKLLSLNHADSDQSLKPSRMASPGSARKGLSLNHGDSDQSLKPNRDSDGMGSGELRGTGGTPGKGRRTTTASGEMGRQEIIKIKEIKAMDGGKTGEEDMAELEVHAVALNPVRI